MVLAKDNSSCPCAVPREFFSPANGVYLFSFIWYIRARVVRGGGARRFCKPPWRRLLLVNSWFCAFPRDRAPPLFNRNYLWQIDNRFPPSICIYESFFAECIEYKRNFRYEEYLRIREFLGLKTFQGIKKSFDAARQFIHCEKLLV